MDGKRFHIAVITAYPDEDWHSQRLVTAARRRGRVTVIRPEQLSAHLSLGTTIVRAGGHDVREFDVVLMPRSLGERGCQDFQLEAYRLLGEQGAVLVNPIASLLDALDKFRSSVLFERHGVPTPASAVVQDASEAQAVLRAWGAAVSKPLYGSLGHGVRLLRAGEISDKALDRACQRYQALYLQRYVPGALGDVRAFVVGGRVIAAIRRLPRRGEFAANAHRGARIEPVEIDAQTADIAVRAARAVGLEYTGVDLVFGGQGPLVLEVNGTPRWEALERATGRDLACAIVDHALSLPRTGIRQHPPRRAHAPTMPDSQSPGARSIGNGR